MNRPAPRGNVKASFQFFDRDEWDRLMRGGGRLGEMAKRAGAGDEMARIEQQIIDIRRKSVNTFPFDLARQTFGDRPIPAWMQVVPGSLRILIHQLPVREQIDVPVEEQLIVELYSK